jgi:hypothetical protein
MRLISRTGYMFLAIERGNQPMHMGGLQRHLSLRTVAATVTRRIRLGMPLVFAVAGYMIVSR